MSTPRILLTNDDGIDAPGLAALREGLSKLGDVRVVAPANQQSAMGRALSYGRGGKLHEAPGELQYVDDGDGYSYTLATAERDGGYAISGTPCDCVVAGIHAFDRRPDVVVSGCNPGPNLGGGAFTRSGTVSAAMEAAYHGVPGIAVSTNAHDGGGYENAVELTCRVVSWLSRGNSIAPADFLNVNVPSGGDPGASITRPCDTYEMSAARGENAFRVTNPMLGDDPSIEIDPEAETDRAAFIGRGEASVTPLSLPQTPVDVEKLEETIAD